MSRFPVGIFWFAFNVKQVLKDELNLDSAPDIERAHRVGKSSRRQASAQNSASRPLTIVCRLRDWKERETILKCARRIKPDNIFVKEDLSPLRKEKVNVQRWKQPREQGRSLILC